MSKKERKVRTQSLDLPSPSLQPKQKQKKRRFTFAGFRRNRWSYCPSPVISEHFNEEYNEEEGFVVVEMDHNTSEPLPIEPAVSLVSKPHEVLMSSICFIGEREQVLNSRSHLLGSNASLSLPAGLCLLDSTQNIQPILTESLMHMLDDIPYIDERLHNTALSGASPLHTGSTYPVISVQSFAHNLASYVHGISPHIPHLLCINEFVNCQDFPLLHYLKPLLFSPGNSIPVLPYSLANPLKDPIHNEEYTYCMKRPTNMDEFTNRVAVAAAICEERKSFKKESPDMSRTSCSPLGSFYDISLQDTQPFQLITAYNEYDYFVKEKCFSDADLAKEGCKMVQKKIEEKIPMLFELNNGKKPPHITPLLVGDNSSSINNEMMELFKDNSQSLEWKQFAFLIFLKAYSQKYRVHAISMKLFYHFASAFHLTSETNILSTFQRQLLILNFESKNSHPAVIIDLQWFFHCLESLKTLSKEESVVKIGEIAMNSKELEKIIKNSSTTSLPPHWLINFLKQHQLCYASSTNNSFYMPLLLPLACDSSTGPTTSNKISPIYLRCLAGPIPPGKFESLFVLLREIPELSLIQSQSRCSVTYQFDDHYNQYYVKISNHHGFIKVFFSSLTSGLIVVYKDVCNITSYIIKKIQEAVSCIFAQTKAPKGLVMYMECQDRQCRHVNPGRVHLAKVCPEGQYIECTLSRPQNVCFSNLGSSQTVWIHQFIIDKQDSKDSVTFKASRRPTSAISIDLQMSPVLPKRHCTDQIVKQYIERHRRLLVQNDDLICSAIPWGHLYSSGYLESLEDIRQKLKEGKANEAINTILASVQKAGIPGVVAFLCSLKDSFAENDCHGSNIKSLYYQLTRNDEDYKLIKHTYLKSIVVRSI